MSNLDSARFQMAYSLGFHMIFAALGVGMPLLMLIAEGLWLHRRSERYLRLAKTWAKATGVLFAIGAVSGTGLSFEMGLLWPRFMGFAGSTIGVAFALEGFAFFLEAIFLGLYLYGWERLRPLSHWLCGLVVATSGAASSVMVVATNAWMQNPVGADLLLTNPKALDPAAALFGNPAWALMSLHSTLATYAATGFAVTGVYAWGALRGRIDDMRRTGLLIALAVGGLAAATMPVTGHMSAQSVAVRQPVKLAAMESQFATEAGAPLRIGGVPDLARREVPFALEVPGGLSWLAFGDAGAVVRGLDQTPEADWPNLPLTHISFQIMVGAGFAMVGAALLAGYGALRRHESLLERRRLMWLLVVASPLGFIALETGWIVTEVGRQPWMIHQVMRTAAAVTPVAGLQWTMAAFVGLYSVLALVLTWLLVRLKHA